MTGWGGGTSERRFAYEPVAARAGSGGLEDSCGPVGLSVDDARVGSDQGRDDELDAVGAGVRERGAGGARGVALEDVAVPRGERAAVQSHDQVRHVIALARAGWT